MSEIFVVSQEDSAKRLDVFLQSKLPNCSRSHIKNLIEKGKVFVDGAVAKKAGFSLKNGAKIEVENQEIEQICTQGENVPFEIVFQDWDVVVVNKPQGLVVHPCSTTKSGTLVNGLIFRVHDLSGINGQLRPGIVHRLDKDTSGLMVVAKNDFAHVNLAEQIKNKTASRKYLALLEGNLKDDEGRVDTFLKRDPTDRKKMSVQSTGRRAVTDFKVLERFSKCCLVEFSLQTGRTHQIRAHAKYLHHPVVGDRVYGHEVKGLDGQLLHAYQLSFNHPRTGERLTFNAPLPDYFENFLSKMRKMQK